MIYVTNYYIAAEHSLIDPYGDLRKENSFGQCLYCEKVKTRKYILQTISQALLSLL
ncbi:MAG: hypothetical protein JW750_03375 [Anaerolineaceae bacterium]|nr:hypothetical protein [Anaerolineaceae bacterium]